MERRERASRRSGAFGAAFYDRVPNLLTKGRIRAGDFRVEPKGITIRKRGEAVQAIDWDELSGIELRGVGKPMDRRAVLALVQGSKVVYVRLWDDTELSSTRLQRLADDLLARKASTP